MTALACFGLRQTLGDGIKDVLRAVGDQFRDHSQSLHRALTRANDRAWQALGVALAGDGLLDGVKGLFTTADYKMLREQIRPFLARSAAHFDQTPAAFRKVCLAELQTARGKNMLSAADLDADTLGRHAASVPFCADPAALLAGSTRTVARLADDLAPHCPNLAHLLRQPAPSGPPLLVAAFAFFFRREVETDDQLARGLTFDTLRQLAADSAAAFAEVDRALAGLGDRFDLALGKLGRIEAVSIATHDAVLDLHAELQALQGLHRAGLDEVRRLLEETMARLGEHRQAPAAGALALEDEERQAVQQLSVRLRRLPEEQRRQAPTLVRVLDTLEQAPPRQRSHTNALGMKFVWVPPGSFLMGSPPEEANRHSDEIQHGVTLSRGLYLAVHPVTQAQWRAVMDASPGWFAGDDRPVERVSWDDCQEFCARLSRRDGRAYRLPSEAEWEYACRAGTAGPFHFGAALTAEQANHDARDPSGKGAFRAQTTPVGSFAPSSWGLFDMHGNVYEWCADWYGPYAEGQVSDPTPAAGDARLLRGGSWLSAACYCRSAYRYWADPATRSAHIGVRVCFTP
jgi:formylglycine-generating enzyme required for sulfatase activity